MYYIPYQITSSLSFKMIISFTSITTCSWFKVISIYIMQCHVQVIILILLTLTLSSYHIHSITFISHILITVKHSYMPYHSIYHYHVHNYQHETLSVFSTWYCLLGSALTAPSFLTVLYYPLWLNGFSPLGSPPSCPYPTDVGKYTSHSIKCISQIHFL